MATLPSGRVTFWVTDVEGSTRLWETAPAAMRSAMERHRDLLGSVATAHRGHVFKDTGDGVLVAFARPDDALAAAVEGMLALERESWPEAAPLRVRMGVHSGDARPSNDDYHAPVVNRTARIGTAAHGGQIVVSADARVGLARPPPDVSFRDLGPHHLRDLAEAVELAQVLHPGLQSQFPALRSLEAAPHNLPSAVSSLVGRGDDIAEVRGLLRSHRLVTLLGPGGVGKTRLALQVAAEEVGRYSDGVWRVELAASNVEAVASNVARTLGVGDQPGRDPSDVVVDHLRDRDVLLLLDDCERVAEPVGRLVRSLLEASRLTRVLATSREPLRVPGEQRWLVAPLPAPRAATDVDIASASDFSSVGLFVERARSVDPSFALVPENVGAISEICRRLDGLPLALELAAARTHVLAPDELLVRLTDRFAILGDSRRGVDPRQRTLGAAVAWSYEMLDDRTRAAFDALSVFAGAFRLDDAIELLRSGDEAGSADFDHVLVIGELVDRSLLQVDSAATGNRYRLLDSIRAYGRDRLAERGQWKTQRGAHREWLAGLARDAARNLGGEQQTVWLERITELRDDVRYGLRSATEDDEAELGLEIAVDLFRFWQIRAVREGYDWLVELLDAATDPRPPAAARAAMYLGYLAQEMGRRDEALERLDACAQFLDDVGERRGLAWVLTWRAQASAGSREATVVSEDLERATTLFTSLGDASGLALAQMGLALTALAVDDVDRARGWIEKLGELRARVEDPHVLAHVHETLAGFDTITGEHLEGAIVELLKALDLYRTLHHPVCGAHALITSSALLATLGDPETAAVLEGAAEHLRTVAGVDLAPIGEVAYDAAHERTIAALAGQTYRSAFDEGSELEYAVAFERAIHALAEH
ncbi:MAG TPA: adenylate/guanylate cyclase domain-containing protein [Acidimicrobiia bacterium]|nr:adenylate/guanylate cyclase domain-containing protein [Acidimicrobiia bacterium]